MYGNWGSISYKANGEGWTRSYMADQDKVSISADTIRLWNDTDIREYGKWEFKGKEMSRLSYIWDGCI